MSGVLFSCLFLVGRGFLQVSLQRDLGPCQNNFPLHWLSPTPISSFSLLSLVPSKVYKMAWASYSEPFNHSTSPLRLCWFPWPMYHSIAESEIRKVLAFSSYRHLFIRCCDYLFQFWRPPLTISSDTLVFYLTGSSVKWEVFSDIKIHKMSITHTHIQICSEDHTALCFKTG